MEAERIEAARREAIRRAGELVQISDLLFLDTETTGLGPDAEIVDVAVVCLDGEVLLDTLVRPVAPISPEATAIHGISDGDVVSAPAWPGVYLRLWYLTRGKTLAIYNVDYDLRLIRQTSARYQNLPRMVLNQAVCVMELFAEFRGERDLVRQAFRWAKLSEAAGGFGVGVEGAHRALADCMMTRSVLLCMAEELDGEDLA